MLIGSIIIAIILIVVIILDARYQRKKREIISTVTPLSRGEDSERDLIYQLITGGIPASTIFHDLYLPCKNGYTQIDLVVPTSAGIFVFEVKDYSGWILGNATQQKWTQVLAYGQEKHQFYNPIKQNEGHISALRSSMEQLQNVPIYSIIIFYGSSEIKKLSNIPPNCWVVYPYEVVNIIKSVMASAPPAPYTDKWEVMRVLRSAVDNGNNEAIRAMHLQRAQRANRGKYQSTYTYRPRFFRLYRGRWRF